MNKIYRTVYNETTNTWVAVEETAKSHRKSAGVVNETAPAREVLSGSLNKMPVIASLAVIAQGSLDAVKKALALTLLTAGGIAGAASVDGSNVGNAGYGDTYNAKSDLVIGVNGETVSDKKADSNGRNTIIGNDAKVVNTAIGKADSSVVIGAGAEAGQKSVAIGGTWTGEGTTQATAYKSVALGSGASAITPRGNALSVGTMALGAHATAIGANNNSASSMDSAATAIGYYSYANGGQSLALGARTRADALQSTAIGNDSLTTGRGAVAIGGDDSGKKDGSDGGYSNAQFTYTGYQKLEGKGTAGNVDINGVQIEAFRPTYAADAASTAISPHAQALTQGSTAIGVGATAGKGVQTQVQNTGDYYEKSTFTPDTDAIETTAVGAMATALEKRSTALGYYSSALGVSSTSVGDRANARGENSTAIGALSLAQANDSGAIGATNYVGALNNDNTKTTTGAENSWAIGNYNNVTSTNTFVIGNYVNAKLDVDGKPIAIKDDNGFITGYESLTDDGTAYNSVYLGDSSIMTHGSEEKDVSAKALKADGTESDKVTTGGAYGEVTKAEIRGRKLNPTTNTWETDGDVIVKYEGAFQGNDSVGGVSVGSAGAERRIMNVAAGQIAPTSTDAINGSQLYAVAANPIKFTANSNKDTGENGDADLTEKDGLGRVLGQSIAVIGSTKSLGLDIDDKGDKSKATAGTYSAENLQTVVDDEKIQIQMAENPIFKSVQLGDKDGPKITHDGEGDNIGDNIKVGDKDGKPTQITNLKGNLTPTSSDENGSLITVDDAGKPVVGKTADNKPTTSATGPNQEQALAMNNNAATVGDVLNAGWNLQGNGTAVDFVKPYDTVNFINGAGTTATVTSDGLTSTVSFDVGVDNKTTQINYVDASGNPVTKNTDGSFSDKDGKPLTGDAAKNVSSQVVAKTTPLTMEENDDKTTTGKVKTPDAPDSLVTAGDVANAINSAHWNIQADKTTGGTVSGNKLQPIKAGDTVDLIAGENVTIKQEQGKFTFSVDIPDASTSPITAKNGLAKLGDVTTYTDADGNPLTQNSDGSYSNADGTSYTGDVTEAKSPADGNKLVTAGDVVNTINHTGWTVGKGSSSDTENDKLITPAGDNNRVGFVEGNGVKITQSGANFIFAVNKADAPAIATADGDTVKKGEVTKPDTNANKYWDANQVADAINNSGWRVTGADTNADGTGGFADTVVTPGDQITLEGGKNVALKQDGNKFIFSVELPEAEQLPVVYTDADGNKVVKNDDGKWVKPALDDDGNPIFDADGNPTTKEVAPENVIASMNNAGDSTTSPMTLSNVASHFADAGDNKTMPDASKPSEFADNKNEAATLGDVLNAGWNLQAEGKAVDFVTHGDTVNFASSNKTVTITDKSADGKDIIDFVVNTDGKTIKPDSNGKLSVQTDGDTIIAGDNGLKVNTGGSQVGDNGKAAPKDGDTNKIATVGDITDTINGVFWKVDASGNGSNAANANNVKAGHQVNFVGGDGVQIDQTNADATTTFTFKVDDSTLNTAGVHPLEFTGDDPAAGKLTPTHGGMVQIKGGATTGTPAAEENAPATASGKNISVNPNGDALEVALAPNVDLGDKGSLKVGKDGDNVTNITPEGVNVVNKDGNSTNVAPDQITFADKDGNPTNTGHIIGLASHLQDPTGKDKNPDSTGYPDVKNEAATVQDVLNAGWNLQAEGKAVDFVTHGDTVNFASSDKSVSISGSTGSTVDFKVNKAENYTANDDGTISAPTPAPITNADGTTTTPAQFWDATQTADAINNAAWQITSSTAGDDVQKVKAGDKVDLQAGTGITIEQDGKNFTFSTNLKGENGIKITDNDDGSQTIKYTGKGDGNRKTTVTNTDGNLLVTPNLKDDNNHIYDVALNNTITVGNEKDGDQPITIDGKTGDITLGGDTGGNINNVANHIKPDGSMIDDKAPTNQAATVQDVLNSGWNVKVGDADPEYIKHGEQVAFIDGKGTKVSGSKDGIAYDINVDQNSPLSINDDGALTVNVGGFDNTTDGSVKANNPNGLATAGDVANAVNNSGWNVTTSASTGEVSGTSKELIKPTNTVTFDAGDNIRIVQSGNQISVGTTRNINVAGNLNVAGDTTVNNLAVNPNSNVDMGGNQIHNVAPGTADTDAVNVSQLRDAIGGNRNWEPRVNQVEKHANAGTAQAIATAGLPQVYLPGKNLVAIGGGVYRGESGYAVGFSSISDNGSWIFKATGSGNSRGNFGGSAAVGYQW